MAEELVNQIVKMTQLGNINKLSSLVIFSVPVNTKGTGTKSSRNGICVPNSKNVSLTSLISLLQTLNAQLLAKKVNDLQCSIIPSERQLFTFWEVHYINHLPSWKNHPQVCGYLSPISICLSTQRASITIQDLADGPIHTLSTPQNITSDKGTHLSSHRR